MDTIQRVMDSSAADVIAMLPGTQQQRASRLGVTQQTVSGWIAGEQEMSRPVRYLVLALLGYQMNEAGHWWEPIR
jgi:hypothetical protein